MKVAVVGATGLVGSNMLKLLKERNFPVSELIPVASARSAGKTITWSGMPWTIRTLEEAVALKPDLALFSAGGDVSKEWAPLFAAAGTTVVDNSSAWRMDPTKKLVVPEINGLELTADDKIIANPNCSTIQLVMVLNPLHKKYGIKRVIVSTYQSITGTGQKAIEQLTAERNGEEAKMVYPYKIDMNCLPHCDVFLENDYTKEEMKLTHETKKILGDDSVMVSATAVRVPVMGGHSESVNIEFENTPDLSVLRQILNDQPGVKVMDHPQMNQYPMPLFAQDKDEVFVGRIRADHSHPKAINMWIVADNLRKGAATNALQIAEKLVERGLL